jgi:phospholipid transport system substrate-binding protein
MKKIIQLNIFIGLVLSLSLVQASVDSAEQIVRSTTDQIFSRMHNERDALESNPKVIYDLINEIIMPNFDFISMSKWVLGKNWGNASNAQQDRFVEEFREMLVRTYAKTLLEFSEDSIDYLPAKNKPDSKLKLVKTIINRQGSANVPIDYRMYKKDNNWKVVDVVINSVSLVSTYRGSFESEIKKNGFDELIIKLTAKNTRLDDLASN